MNQNVVIREIEDYDYEDIATFYSIFSNDSQTKEFWIRRLLLWWDDNPAYKYGHPRGVIAQVDGKIVGITCNFPTRIIWEGKPQIVINGSSWKVLPEYRKFSIDIWEKHREITNNYIMFNTTPNSFVRKLLVTTKQQELNVTKSYYYYFGFPKSLFHSLSLIAISSISKIMVKGAVKLSNLKERDIELKIIPIDYVKNEIDKLWIEHRNDFLYTNIRDSAYLKWISSKNDVLFVYLRKEFKGFLIFNIDPQKREVMLVDFWSNDLMEYAKPITNKIITYYEQMNLVIPSFCPKLEKACRVFLLLRRKNTKTGFIIKSDQIPIKFEKSFLTKLQGDYGM